MLSCNFVIKLFQDFYSQPILKYNPSEVTNDCEDICSIMKSSINSNYLYVATTHNLIQIDIRNGKNVQKWTHLMQNPPQFFNCVEKFVFRSLILI